MSIFDFQKFTFCIAMYLMQGFKKEIYLYDLSYNVWMVISLDIDSDLYDEVTKTFQEAFENLYAYCNIHLVNKM